MARSTPQWFLMFSVDGRACDSGCRATRCRRRRRKRWQALGGLQWWSAGDGFGWWVFLNGELEQQRERWDVDDEDGRRLTVKLKAVVMVGD
ncbi:hypothetical protein Dimus_029142, partial [Dionaea muscipula]